MNPTEHTTNIVIALINNSRVSTPDQVCEAYKKIYSTIINPQ